jgi:hypothetical protein
MISLFAADPSDVYKQCGTVEEIDLVGLFCAEFFGHSDGPAIFFGANQADKRRQPQANYLPSCELFWQLRPRIFDPTRVARSP